MARQKQAEAKTAAKTSYVVLRQVMTDDDGSEQAAWLPVGAYSAGGKTAAIRMHTGDGPDVIEGGWKAIPESSWKGGETTKRVTAAARLPLD